MKRKMFLITSGCFSDLQRVKNKSGTNRAYLKSYLYSHFLLRIFGDIRQHLWKKKIGGLRTSSVSPLRSDNRGSITVELALLIPLLVTFIVGMNIPLYAINEGIKNAIETYNCGVVSDTYVSLGSEQFCLIPFSVSEEEWVYLTPYESVYHSDRKCAYLNRKVHVGLSYLMDFKRNHERKRYHACTVCDGDSFLPLAYYTDYGTAWHKDTDCPALRRAVYAIRLQEAAGLKECSQCIQKQ